jgi:hypothetical protein
MGRERAERIGVGPNGGDVAIADAAKVRAVRLARR